MLNKYILGDKIIETTEERYERSFKDAGYVPYVEKKKTFISEKNKDLNKEENFENKVEDKTL